MRMLAQFQVIIYKCIYKLQRPLKAIEEKGLSYQQMINPSTQLVIKQKEKIQEWDYLDSISMDSDLFLSKIEYDEAFESPQINYNRVEAKIKELTETAADPVLFKKSKPFCGCGQFYSCTSSLYLHIRSKHQGKPPAGTIGGPKGIVKKPVSSDPVIKVQQEANKNYTAFEAPKPVTNPVSSEHDPEASNIEKQRDNYSHRSRNKQGQKKIPCKLCNKTYSCNSSLNLHFKRKHELRKTQDGRTQMSERVQQDKNHPSFPCSMCPLSYGSKSALGLHFNLKHTSKNLNNSGSHLDEANKTQKCGCGLVYQSRSALNMHVKKKHDGQYPVGTTEKPNLRQSGQYREEINRIENRLRNQQNSENYQEQSIYDSDSDQNKSHQKEKTQRMKRSDGEIAKPYRCGCGRLYSCSSSLNLHIKKNHNWVIPAGTIGGPRGMRYEEENKPIKKPPPESEKRVQSCSQCRKQVDGSYFQCKSCESHQMCSNCFWNGGNTSEEHRWQVVKSKS